MQMPNTWPTSRKPHLARSANAPESHHKTRAVGHVQKRDFRVMGAQDVADDGQAHAGAALIAPGGEEAVDDAGGIAGGDAGEVVFDASAAEVEIIVG